MPLPATYKVSQSHKKKQLAKTLDLTQGEYAGSYTANPYVQEIQCLLNISLQMSADSIIFICPDTQSSTYLNFRKW